MCGRDDLIFDFGITESDAPLLPSSSDDTFSQSPFSRSSIALHSRAIRRCKRWRARGGARDRRGH